MVCVYVHVLVPFSGLRCGALIAHDLTLRVTVGVSNTQLKSTFFTTMQELICVASTNMSALRTSVFVPNGSPIAIRWALAKFCTNIGTHMKSRFKT